MQITVIQDVSERFRGRATLVRRGEQFFAISSTSVFGTSETMAFPCDADGRVTDWGEVAGGKLQTFADVMRQLENMTDADLAERMGDA